MNDFVKDVIGAYAEGCTDPLHLTEYHGIVMSSTFQDWFRSIRDPKALPTLPPPPHSWTSADKYTPIDFAAVTAEAMKDIRGTSEIANLLAKLSDEELLKGLDNLWNLKKPV